jgi:hypothetical protein
MHLPMPVLMLGAGAIGYVVGNLAGNSFLRDLERWLSSPPNHRPDWNDR